MAEERQPITRIFIAIIITILCIFNLFTMPNWGIKLSLLGLCVVIWMGVMEKPAKFFKKQTKKSE